MQEQRPTVTPARNTDSAPVPTPNATPTTTPNAEGPPPRKRGEKTERLRKVKDTRHAIAQRRWPNISHHQAQRVCLHRQDRSEHLYTPRGRVRLRRAPEENQIQPDSLAARCLERFDEMGASTTDLARQFGVTPKIISRAFQQLASHGLIERASRDWWTLVEAEVSDGA